MNWLERLVERRAPRVAGRASYAPATPRPPDPADPEVDPAAGADDEGSSAGESDEVRPGAAEAARGSTALETPGMPRARAGQVPALASAMRRAPAEAGSGRAARPATVAEDDHGAARGSGAASDLGAAAGPPGSLRMSHQPRVADRPTAPDDGPEARDGTESVLRPAPIATTNPHAATAGASARPAGLSSPDASAINRRPATPAVASAELRPADAPQTHAPAALAPPAPGLSVGRLVVEVVGAPAPPAPSRRAARTLRAPGAAAPGRARASKLRFGLGVI